MVSLKCLLRRSLIELKGNHFLTAFSTWFFLWKISYRIESFITLDYNIYVWGIWRSLIELKDVLSIIIVCRYFSLWRSLIELKVYWCFQFLDIIHTSKISYRIESFVSNRISICVGYSRRSLIELKAKRCYATVFCDIADVFEDLL